ncbi:NAD dependent epimerase/dehydratase family protein [Sporormia fimetaria CBS 119925]|uniref:NAD dependent epimerase/dehydratase family protein n=1 Tax=Sporormia fimetaria CBS 119925 TaxID=1340428 RepID=A0A6A6V287_9PLEO|nr:NAD dependent epimerase/dehydratase family protein [Sporormia fimetaria CBS 119925]
MSTAIVTGATGILGRQIVKELSQDTQTWKKIYALSRSKKDECPQNVEHTHLDLTGSAEDMAKEISKIDAEYLFFAAYLEKGDAEELDRVNGEMLENFLKALEINKKASSLKRIVLVCGLKQYGVHLGVPKAPMEESDKWLPEPPKNFYYRQQRSLHAFCEKNGVEWTVTYPNDVLGVAKGNFMNFATTVALYAAIQTELGDELPFPGTEGVYKRFDMFTTSKLHAEFVHWAALEPRAANQAFNVVNGDIHSWQTLWPRIAQYFGLHVASDEFSRPAPDHVEMQLNERAPLDFFAKEIGLEGRVQPSKLQNRIDLNKWSQKPEVQDAWKKLAERHSLDKDAIDKATWEFAGFIFGRDYDIIASISKARAMGWTGYEDSWESFKGIFGDLEKEKVIPPQKK